MHIRHQASPPFCYPINSTTLRLVVHTDVDSCDAVHVLWRDRMVRIPEGIKPPSEEKALWKFGSDGIVDFWTTTISLEEARFWYTFRVTQGSRETWYGQNGPTNTWQEQWGYWPQTVESEQRYGLPSKEPFNGFHYACINEADIQRHPSWLNGSTIYQIFVDRFRNGAVYNDPQGVAAWGTSPTELGNGISTGGDLAGLAEKIDYLKELGVNAVYTTPVFSSTSSHKYNTADYLTVDPAFGSNELLTQVAHDLNQAGIRVILDGVFNHSGIEFFAFQDVIKNGEQSAYLDWYSHIESFPVDPSRSNYRTFGDNYGDLPKFNLSNPECRKYLLDAVAHWTNTLEMSGWRIDVANELERDFVRELRTVIKTKNPEHWLLGEILPEASDWLRGDMYDNIMNYQWMLATIDFLSGHGNVKTYTERLTRQLFWYPSGIIGGQLTVLGSHDMARITSILGVDLTRIGAILQFTHTGLPVVYYGDEVGMHGSDDPDCRRCMDWTEQSWDRTTQHLYKRLIALRKEHPWLNNGAWEPVYTDTLHNILAIERSNTALLSEESGAERLLVLVNPNPFPARVPLSVFDGYPAPLSYDYLTERHLDLSSGFVELEAFGGVVLV